MWGSSIAARPAESTQIFMQTVLYHIFLSSPEEFAFQPAIAKLMWAVCKQKMRFAASSDVPFLPPQMANVYSLHTIETFALGLASLYNTIINSKTLSYDHIKFARPKLAENASKADLLVSSLFCVNMTKLGWAKCM